MIDVILHQRAALGIVVEGGERCERNLFHCIHLINPEEGLQIVAHLIGLALQVAAFACHQEEHATGGVVHAFDISRIMDVAQILYIDHTFITRRNDGTVEVLHHTADGECHTFFWIFGIGISKLKFLAHRLLIGPAALSKSTAHHNLVGSFEHLMLITREQLVVEEFEEVGTSHEHLCIDILPTQIECCAVARHGTPALNLGESILQTLTDAEVRHHEALVAQNISAVSTRLVILDRRLSVNQVAQEQQERHRQAKANDIDDGKQPMTAQKLQITFHYSISELNYLRSKDTPKKLIHQEQSSPRSTDVKNLYSIVSKNLTRQGSCLIQNGRKPPVKDSFRPNRIILS